MSLKSIFAKAMGHPDVRFLAEWSAVTGAAVAVATGCIGAVYGATLSEIFLGAATVGAVPAAVATVFGLAVYGAEKGIDVLRAARRPAPVAPPARPLADDVRGPGRYGPDLFY